MLHEFLRMTSFYQKSREKNFARCNSVTKRLLTYVDMNVFFIFTSTTRPESFSVSPRIILYIGKYVHCYIELNIY